ncbi:unnamed protein product [Dicrocoelium dendriticum]|nr:unnamed protein product [Dicrocoelium dendriticum]
MCGYLFKSPPMRELKKKELFFHGLACTGGTSKFFKKGQLLVKGDGQRNLQHKRHWGRFFVISESVSDQACSPFFGPQPGSRDAPTDTSFERWRERYCVLYKVRSRDKTEIFFEYYKDSHCTKLKGQVDLKNCDCIIDDDNSDEKWPNVFSVQTVHNGQKRVYYFSAPSAQNMSDWVRYLVDVTGFVVTVQPGRCFITCEPILTGSSQAAPSLNYIEPCNLDLGALPSNAHSRSSVSTGRLTTDIPLYKQPVDTRVPCNGSDTCPNRVPAVDDYKIEYREIDPIGTSALAVVAKRYLDADLTA